MKLCKIETKLLGLRETGTTWRAGRSQHAEVEKKKELDIEFINMQGGRNGMKWAQFRKQLNAKRFTVNGVAEVQLRDEEKPLYIPGYVSMGFNRIEVVKRHRERKGNF